MKKRLLQLPENQSFFLFGARNTGKSTLIQDYCLKKDHLYLDLLDVQLERRYLQNPQQLKAEVTALPAETQLIVIDEVQKIPALLDVVHSLIEGTDKRFILTGSSARKLRHGHANLLAGRAVMRHLFPFSYLELGDDFDLDRALRFGLLPRLEALTDDAEIIDFLNTYTHVYLKDEIWAEHLIRKLEPFQYFLEVAAQSNGKIINASKIAHRVGVDSKSVMQYFSILDDTLLGFHLPAFRHSFRKRLSQKPKFYFIDTGITRALARTLALPIAPGNYEYGDLFEHFIVLECYKLTQYYHVDYRLSYLRTHEGLEVDLVVERPGLPLLFIEIKSNDDVQPEHLKPLRNLAHSFTDEAEYVCLSRVPRALKFDDVLVLPWEEGLMRYFSQSKVK